MNNIITSLIALSLVILISCMLAKTSLWRETFSTGDICTVKLSNINPMFVKNYMQYDGQPIKCFNKLSSNAFCVGGTLKLDVIPVENDKNGMPISEKQVAVISNSNGSTPPDNAKIPIDPWGFPNYFCLE